MSNFVDVNDVMCNLEIRKSKTYTVIKTLNEELKKQGFLTVKGKVPKKYFQTKIYFDID